MHRMPREPKTRAADPKLGPHGGRTTVSASGDMVRKTFYIDRVTENALRDEAYQTRRSEADIVREALQERYGIE